MFRLAVDCMKAHIKDWHAAQDGTRFKYGDELATFEGNARAVLTASWPVIESTTKRISCGETAFLMFST